MAPWKPGTRASKYSGPARDCPSALRIEWGGAAAPDHGREQGSRINAPEALRPVEVPAQEIHQPFGQIGKASAPADGKGKHGDPGGRDRRWRSRTPLCNGPSGADE